MYVDYKQIIMKDFIYLTAFNYSRVVCFGFRPTAFDHIAIASRFFLFNALSKQIKSGSLPTICFGMVHR